VKFDVSVSAANGDFEVVDSDSLSASGRVYLVESADHKPFVYDHMDRYQNLDKSGAKSTADDARNLLSADVYKELLLRGYEYGPK